MKNNTTNTDTEVQLQYVQLHNEGFFKISNSDLLRPFFMSIVSDSNHWMFISSNGGLTAGRKNAEYSLFPYYTDDKITESIEVTGSKSIFHVTKNNKHHLWEPFSERFYGIYNVNRNLYKNIYGNKIIFEEINHDLGLSFTYEWNSSDTYGFVRKSRLMNNGNDEVKISILDGIQNILPNGVGSDLQNKQSNLVDAYKRSEILKDHNFGVYALSAIIVDKAEPSEALKANIAWSLGMDHPLILLSSLQLNNFRNGIPLKKESDIKAEKGAFFLHEEISLNSGAHKQWVIVADVNKDHAAIAEIKESIREEKDLLNKIEKDVSDGTERLISLAASSDGLQITADNFRDTRHFSNTLFNIMRGGIFDNNYSIEKWDFTSYLAKANKEVYNSNKHILDELPDEFSAGHIQEIIAESDDSDFRRLCSEYMPLKFSRRHGDPSRPWNRFSINTQSEVDGSKILDYEGNWRDIFQNWEALAHSYPGFIDSMIQKFLNATTFDGYNPYRVTKGGFDWEIIEPDDPWSYIGYWGDHQIIYLLKFLEFKEDHSPGELADYFDKDDFVYANVPYRIKSYDEILQNPKDTIDFDHQLDTKIRRDRLDIGADGALLRNKRDAICRVNFVEKILATVLAKLSNFIPEGGIWMNTQRPEWNDANNALVGNGVSMVTLCYLRRFLNFFKAVVSDSELAGIEISEELKAFFTGVASTLRNNQSLLSGSINDIDRKKVLDGLGKAGSDFRSRIYNNGFSGEKESLSIKDLQDFIDLGLAYADHSIKSNKRADNLYHAYNLMTVESENEVSISYLSEMLEGQVAVLSSGLLNPDENLELLNALKSSKLFREDQYSYLLYPNKELSKFAERNIIPSEVVEGSQLLSTLVKDGNVQIIVRDIEGQYHFNGDFKNVNDLKLAMSNLASSEYAELKDKEENQVYQIFEDVFNHKAFTGRSGTFFGYEGLGSIYWHMVSKLQLAVQESCLQAIMQKSDDATIGKLLEHYYEINEGIGVHKSPSLYGAFPTDPYSHTPQGKGAQQPGMTGQVKEDILSRFGELGIFVKGGKLCFEPSLLRQNEFLSEPSSSAYVDINGARQPLELSKNSLCFTYCQVPVIYRISESEEMEVIFSDGSSASIDSLELDVVHSKKIFDRSGEIQKVLVDIKEDRLR